MPVDPTDELAVVSPTSIRPSRSRSTGPGSATLPPNSEGAGPAGIEEVEDVATEWVSDSVGISGKNAPVSSVFTSYGVDDEFPASVVQVLFCGDPESYPVT